MSARLGDDIMWTKHLFCQWNKYKNSSSNKAISPDSGKDSLISGGNTDGQRNLQQVPKGFVAVYVGREGRRFVIPTSYLSMPDFRVLLDKVAEEYGYEQEEGGLRIPYDEQDFEDVLARCCQKHQIMSKTRKFIR